jgi:hypothetical protein
MPPFGAKVAQSVVSVSLARGGWISMEEATQWSPFCQYSQESTTHFTLVIGSVVLSALPGIITLLSTKFSIYHYQKIFSYTGKNF